MIQEGGTDCGRQEGTYGCRFSGVCACLVYVYVCMCECMYMCTCVSLCACVSVCAGVHVYVYTFVFRGNTVFMCIHVDVRGWHRLSLPQLLSTYFILF